MTILEAKEILLKIPNLTTRERKALKIVVAMIDRKNSASYYSLDSNDLSGEEWRDIVGYEGLYMVSNMGRIKSFYSNKARIIKPSKRSDEYISVGLYKGGHSVTHYVHVLVARAFLLNPEDKPQLNHINGDKTDNRVENLKWVTGSENMNHAYKIGLANATKGICHPNAKLTPEQVRYIREHYVKGSKEFGSEALARKFNVTGSVIRDAVHHRSYVDIT